MIMSGFTIGTRGSPLALWQAREVQRLLAARLGISMDQIPLAVIRTSGDAIQDRALAEAGGKGLFTKEIDEAQFDGRARLAVHSAKDLPTRLPDGLMVAGYLPRAAVQDALISRHGGGLDGLPRGARIGTASLRRQALLKRLRPDLVTELLRGNVETRLRAISEGRFDATLLALAGLKRLGLDHHATAILDETDFPPAPGQGAIAITLRAYDEEAAKAVAKITCQDTGHALAAERAFLDCLDGSCRTPIAGYAQIKNGQLHFSGLLLSADGQKSAASHTEGSIQEAAQLGRQAGDAIRSKAPDLIPAAQSNPR
jgi:hydroxymethylbilane synthase